jgi:hypothetical protein
MFEAFAEMLQKASAGELHKELARWSKVVLEAASHMQYSSQEVFAEQMKMEPVPLPFLPSHQKKCGEHYSSNPLYPEEKDGHITRAAALGLETKGEISLKGAFASMSPMYLRRETEASETDYRLNIVKDYRKGIILNHFHKCTKSCFKKASSETALTICRFGCQHAELLKLKSDAGEIARKCLFRGWPACDSPRFQHIPQGDESHMSLFPVFEAGKCQTVRRHPLEGTSHPLLQAVMRCNVDVKFMGRGLSQELLDTLDELTAELSEEPKPKKKRLSTKTKIKADRLAGMFAIRPNDSQSRFKAIVIQLLLDTIRDQLDAQHYVGEYATKKFEVAKDLLPELYKGLLRLQTERQAAVNAQTVLDVPHQIDGPEPAVSSVAQAAEAAPALAVDAPVVVKSTAQTRQVRARQTLMRLATSMQRCLSKSNGEMTFHIV